MTAQEVGGRGKGVRLGADHVDMAVAVAIDAEFQHVGRQELRLADFAMGSTARIGAQVAALDEVQCRIELIGEIVGAAAVKRQRRDGRKRVFLAHEAAETGFHAPDRDDRAGRDAVAALDRIEESWRSAPSSSCRAI